MVSLYEISEMMQEPIVCKYMFRSNKWLADISGLEIREGGVLISPCCGHSSVIMAIRKLADQLQGKIVVFNANLANEKEYKLPSQIDVRT